MRRNVIIMESDFIIGSHIKEMLQNKGFKVFDKITSADSIADLPNDMKPDVVIVNQKSVNIKYELIKSKLRQSEKVRFIIIYCLEPRYESSLDFEKYNIEYIEKPFAGYEILNAVSN